MQDQNNENSKKQTLIIVMKIAVCIVLLIVLVCLVFYGWYRKEATQYNSVYFPNTLINGIDTSNKTVKEVQSLIVTEADTYQLAIIGRDGLSEVIKKEEIGLHSVFDGSLDQILTNQNPMEWYAAKKQVKTYQIETMITYDEQMLKTRINKLSFFDEDQMIKPEDASLSEYVAGQGYTIIEEVQGNEVIEEIVEEKIITAIQHLQPELFLEQIDGYISPAITKEDPQLQLLLETLNRYSQIQIIYQFGDQSEFLTGDMVHDWLTVQQDGQVLLNKEAVAAYVKSLASFYNTAYQPKTLNTSYGQSVKITAGNYGWRIDQSAEVDALVALIEAGESLTRQPIYLQTAASHGSQDFGNTYVEINLTAQHLFFYQDGELLIESDFVSGNVAKGYDTPAGVFPLTYKQRNATLRGEGYATPVSYWMPFNGGIGLHDASWRSSFGKTIYKTSGSHGCINLPPSVAKTIYEHISAGMPVLCYHLQGTENSGNQIQNPEVETTVSVAPVPETPSVLPETSAVVPVPETPHESESIQVMETTQVPNEIAPETTLPSQTEVDENNKGPGLSGGGEIIQDMGPGVR